jgi:hypothetical protein
MMTWSSTASGRRRLCRRLAILTGCLVSGVLLAAGPASAYEHHLTPFTFSNLSYHKLTLVMTPQTLINHDTYKGIPEGAKVPARSQQAFDRPPTPRASDKGQAQDVLVTFQYRVDGIPNTYVDFIVHPEEGSLGTFESCTFDHDRRASPDTIPYNDFPILGKPGEDSETTAGPDHMACGWDLSNQPFFLQPKYVRLPN